MPTALEAGRYHSKGFGLQRQVQRGRATGLPAPSICASAASSSGEMTGVECLRKSGPYACQVAAGLLTSAWPRGKNISVGLRHIWTIQFAAAHRAAMAASVATMRTHTGVLQKR